VKLRELLPAKGRLAAVLDSDMASKTFCVLWEVYIQISLVLAIDALGFERGQVILSMSLTTPIFTAFHPISLLIFDLF